MIFELNKNCYHYFLAFPFLFSISHVLSMQISVVPPLNM